MKNKILRRVICLNSGCPCTGSTQPRISNISHREDQSLKKAIEIELENDFEPVIYELPPMEISMDDMQIESIEVEVMSMDATDMMPNFENIEVFDQELSMPETDYFDIGMPNDMEMFEVAPMSTDELVEMFTDEPEFIEEPMDEPVMEIMTEKPPMEETPIEDIKEPVMMASAEPEPIIEEKPMQEVVME